MPIQSCTSIFEPRDFALKLSQKLFSFSENEQFSDICIIASDDVKFHAHKCVLSASSDYFMVMFGGSLKEATASEVKIHEVDGKVLKPILAFLYTGRVNFENDSVEDILVAANFFQIKSLIDECNFFMDENMDAKNCLGIAMFAHQHGFTELSDIASNFASMNFEKVCMSKDFLNLEEDILSAIVSSDDLCVTSEEAFFLNIIEWIEHDKPNREKSACNLFSKLRYWLLRPEFIKQHRSKLPKNVQTIEMVCNWLEWHSLPDSQRESKKMEITKPKNKTILFVGGGGIQTYDPVLRNWSREEVSNLPRRFDSMILFENKLVFSTEDRSLKSFDLQTQEITNFEPRMNVPSRSFGLAVLKDELYAISGHNNGTHHVEKYNSTNRIWHNVPPLNQKLGTSKVAVVNGQLYVVGSLSRNMACFDPIKNQWISKRILTPSFTGCGFTGVSGNVYLIGGKAPRFCEKELNLKSVKTVKSFDQYGILCTRRAKMKVALSDPHCIGLNGRLITCGGLDENDSYLNLVQEYNPNLNEWRTLPPLIEYNPLEYDYGLVAFERKKIN